MKERAHEFELHTKRLQQKLKEAENKLWEKENSESQSLLNKINVLGEELRQHEQGDCLPRPPSAEKPEATPVLSRMENIYEVDPLGQKSLNSTNRTINQEPSLLQGNTSLRELRRKGDIKSRGMENNFLISASSLEKKRLPSESSKAKHLDSSRVSAKITTSTKSIRGAQKTTSNTANRINKDQGAGARDNKFKVWLR